MAEKESELRQRKGGATSNSTGASKGVAGSAADLIPSALADKLAPYVQMAGPVLVKAGA